MMKTGPMLWAAALYNNGGFPIKRPRFGESYGADGVPERVLTLPPPTLEETLKKGVLAWLDPLPRFEVGQPGNVLRVFERGQQRPLEIGVPFVDEAPGRPANRLSQRGLGTLNRTDPVWLNLQKTRLFDPALSFLGNNEHPGEFRSSGCSGCHVLYANDRSAVHSGEAARHGHQGKTATADPTIPKDEPGHPIRHQFTNSIPSSQCVVCHHHPGTTVTNSYLGTIWWDNETDGHLMYPAKERKLTPGPAVRDPAGQPRGGGGPRPVGGQEVPRQRDRPEPQAHAHAVRRLPRPRLGVPQRLQGRPQGPPARRRRQGRGRRGPRPLQEGGAPQGHPPREGDALLGLPLQAGQPRQRQAVRRDAGRRRDHLRRLPRQHQGEGEPQDLGPGRPGRRHRPVAADDAVRAAPLPVAGRHADPAVDGHQGSAVGGRAGPRLDRSRLGVGARESQAGGEVAAGQDAAPRRHHLGRRRGRRTPSWPTPTARCRASPATPRGRRAASAATCR